MSSSRPASYLSGWLSNRRTEHDGLMICPTLFMADRLLHPLFESGDAYLGADLMCRHCEDPDARLSRAGSRETKPARGRRAI